MLCVMSLNCEASAASAMNLSLLSTPMALDGAERCAADRSFAQSSITMVVIAITWNGTSDALNAAIARFQGAKTSFGTSQRHIPYLCWMTTTRTYLDPSPDHMKKSSPLSSPILSLHLFQSSTTCRWAAQCSSTLWIRDSGTPTVYSHSTAQNPFWNILTVVNPAQIHPTLELSIVLPHST